MQSSGLLPTWPPSQNQAGPWPRDRAALQATGLGEQLSRLSSYQINKKGYQVYTAALLVPQKTNSNRSEGMGAGLGLAGGVRGGGARGTSVCKVLSGRRNPSLADTPAARGEAGAMGGGCACNFQPRWALRVDRATAVSPFAEV